MPAYYPVFLDIRGKRCLVVGGGSVAERKVQSLLACGAKVTVLSHTANPALRALVERGDVDAELRGYSPGDADGYFVVVAATDDRALNQQVFADVEARGGLVNTVDDPEHCRFIVPSVVERGSLTVAISTAGKSPALARQMREEIEAIFPAEYADYLEQLSSLRRRLRERMSDSTAREETWRALMASGLLDLLKQGRTSEAEGLLEQVVEERQ